MTSLDITQAFPAEQKPAGALQVYARLRKLRSKVRFSRTREELKADR